MRSSPTPTLAVAAALLALAGVAHAQPDPLLGQRTWMQCRACHALKAGDPVRSGPSLQGMFGRTAATRADFAYSPALKASKIVWSLATLDAFIASPSTVVKGTRMGFAGISDPAKREALIAYLQQEAK